MNEDFGFGYFKNEPRDIENVDDNLNVSLDDCEEFRPMQVIDYQNQSQNQSTFRDESPFADNCSSKQLDLHFPRKIIEYDHKSKFHSWNWFCPVIQIEYNHTKTGLSLHEHPPPKSVETIQSEQTHDDYKQLRQPKWGQIDRDRFSGVKAQEQHPQQHQNPHYQSRYENRHNNPSSNNSPNEMYNRRNPQDKNWTRNSREWNISYNR